MHRNRNYYIILGITGTLFPIMVDASLLTITSTQQYEQIIHDNKHVLVEFAADWCGVCSSIKKPFEEITQEAEFKDIAFARVNTDQCEGLCKQNNIVGVPTFVYVKNGTKATEEIGIKNPNKFKEDLRDHLRTTFALAQNNTPVESIQNTEKQTINTAPLQQEQGMPLPSAPEESQGFFAKIYTFFLYLLTQIKEFFAKLVAMITGN